MLAAGISTLSAQLEALRLDVAVLGGRLDAVVARLERLAATPPPAPVVVTVPAAPSPPAPAAFRLPLVRAALAEPLPTGPAPPVVPAQQVRGTAADGAPARTPDVA